MDGKRPLNRGHPQRNEPNFIPDDTTSNPNTKRPATPPDQALMAHYSAAAAMGQLDQSYDHLFSHMSHPGSTSVPPFYNLMQQSATPQHHTTTPPIPFPWNNPIPQQSFQQPQAGPSQYHSMMNMGALQFPPIMTQGTTSQPPQPQVALDMMGQPSILPEVESEVAEEKRRRNTAASARFRIKKKHKTIALERSVADLSGRADDLEREAADLRRENSWLKEIVMLKGAQFAANNHAHQEALRQAAALVASGQIASTPVTRDNSKEHSEEESEDESDAEDDNNRKGKEPARTRKKA